MNTFVKMLRNFSGKSAGETYEMDSETAKSWIEGGLCEEVKNNPVESEIENFKKSLDNREEQLIAKLSQQIAKSEVKIPAQVKSEDDKPEENFWVAIGQTASEDMRVKEKAYNLLKNKYNSVQKTDMTQAGTTTGGFMVPVEYISRLLSVEGYEGVTYPNRVSVIPTAVRVVNLPLLDQTLSPTGLNSAFYGGVQLQVLAEDSAPSDYTQPAFKQLSLTVQKRIAVTQVSNELLRMSPISVEGLINNLYRRASIAHIDANVLVGSGSNEFYGIVNNAATVSIKRTAAGKVNLADLASMWAAFKPMAGSDNSPSVAWIMNPAAIGQLPIAGSPNHLAFLMQGAQVPFSLSLFGIPILRSEALPALGQSGDVLLVDLAAYAVAIGQEVTVDASSHYGFTSDSTFYRLTWLAQGKPMITAPITLLDGVTQVSPFVELSSTVAS